MLAASEPTAPSTQARFLWKIISVASLVCLLVPIANIVGHQSDNPVILGRYSAAWAVFLIIYVILLVAAVVAVIQFWRPRAVRLGGLLSHPGATAALIVIPLTAYRLFWTRLPGEVIYVPALHEMVLVILSLVTIAALVSARPQPVSGIDQTDQRAAWLRTAAISGAMILYLVVLLRTAWLNDDAYITLRTVDNFVHGHGLTWNVGERVQAFTHPLWMFLLSAGYLVTREAFYTTLVLSMLVSLSVVAVYAFGIARSTFGAVLAVLILTASKAFVEYSTSGLENPLTHLLLGLFYWLYLREENRTPRRLFWVSLLAGLGTLNRSDALLLFLPPLLWAMWQQRSWRTLFIAAAGFLPFMIWEAFSVWYYGFLFPNTAYAKLNAGIPQMQLARNGLYYLGNALRMDKLPGVVIIAGILTPFAVRKRSLWMVAAGVALYLIYIVGIGGDFMTGRFLTAPLMGGLALIQRLPLERAAKPTQALALAAILGMSLINPMPVLLSGPGYNTPATHPNQWWDRGVADERGWYYQCAGLMAAGRQGTQPTCGWAKEGRDLRAQNVKVSLQDSIGFRGYYAGPTVHIIDVYAVADPLLARLPVADPNARVGHYVRNVPGGYYESLQNGQNMISDPGIVAYYDKVLIITRGSLWDPARLRVIWEINTGAYDALIPHAPGAGNDAQDR